MMSHQDRRELLRQKTRTAAAVNRRAERKLAESRDEALVPGDLVVSPMSEHLPVEWLVLERSGVEPAGLVVVPVDTMALCGTDDVELHRAETGGPITARCRYATRVPTDRLNPSLRTGRVENGWLAAVRERCRACSGLPDLRSADGMSERHPDYEDWIDDVVLPAWRSFQEEAASVPPPPAAPSRLAPPLPAAANLPLATRGVAGSRWDRIAASLLLAAGLALAAGWYTDRRHLDSLSHRAENAPVPIPVAFLASEEQLRGEAEAVELPKSAERFVLVLFLDPAQLFDRYRVEIVSGDSRVAIPGGDDMPRGERAHLGLELPRRLMPDGRYTLRLYGLTAAAPGAPREEAVGEFLFEVVSARL